MTVGDFERTPDQMYAEGQELIAHRISGSFHWQLKLNSMGFGGQTFSPSHRTAFMDTGTTLTLMPKKDWIALYDIICANLPAGASCSHTNAYYLIRGYKANKDKFGPISVTLDNVTYSIPFERFFLAFTDDTLMLNINTKESMIVFGMQYLSSFYQVFDMQRNQMALVPNIYASDMAVPVVSVRKPMAVVLPSLTTCIVILTYLVVN